MPGDQLDARGNFQRHHAGVVHRRDADADHGAAERNVPARIDNAMLSPRQLTRSRR